MFKDRFGFFYRAGIALIILFGIAAVILSIAIDLNSPKNDKLKFYLIADEEQILILDHDILEDVLIMAPSITQEHIPSHLWDEGYRFVDWFFDEDFSIPFDSNNLGDNRIVYGKLEIPLPEVNI